MKKIDIIKLSSKNLFNNFSRSILTIITLILLSIVIILMCNFCLYFKKTTDENILNNINTYGTCLNFKINYDNCGNPLIPKLETEDITAFIDKAEKLNLMQDYNFRFNDISNEFYIVPVIGGYDFEILEGSNYDYKDRGKNYIWINEEYKKDKNLNINEKLTININGTNIEFIIKGITDGYSCIDYSYFDITGISVSQNTHKYNDYSIIKTLLEFQKIAPENTKIYEDSVFYIGYYYVLGLSVFLTFFAILFSLSSILNILKINIEENNYSIGIMKSLGMKKNAILLYILTQIIILIILSTILATLISWILTIITLNMQIDLVGNMFDYDKAFIKTGFNFLIPLLNLFILGIFIFLGSLKMLRKYTKKEAIKIINGVD